MQLCIAFSYAVLLASDAGFEERASTDINKIDKPHVSLTEVNSINYVSLFLLVKVLRQIKASA